MALINTGVLSGLTDRVAQQASLLITGINNTRGGTPFYVRVHQGVPVPGDYSVENDFIDGAHASDINTMSGILFRNVYTDLINSMETHTVSNNSAVSFDSFLNTSGVNVNPNFEEVWFRVKNVHLDAVNVFFADANVLVATYTVTGSGTGTYASNNVIGTGTGKVSTTNHAAAKFILVPVQNVTSEIQVNLRLLKENLAGGTVADSANIRFPAGILSGTQIPVNNWNTSGASISNMYLDSNNIVAAGGGGTDIFRVYALKEREVAL
jgi:hypothetical protein